MPVETASVNSGNSLTRMPKNWRIVISVIVLLMVGGGVGYIYLSKSNDEKK